MQKEKRSALIRFFLSVAAVVVGTMILGSMAGGQEGYGGRPEGRFMERPGTWQEQSSDSGSES